MGFSLNGLNELELGNIGCQSCGACDDTVKHLLVYDDIFEHGTRKNSGMSIPLCKTCRTRLLTFLTDEDKPKDRICAFCGQPKKRIKGNRYVYDIHPCADCLKNWEQGIPIVRVSKTPGNKNMPFLSIKDGPIVYPTSQYVVVSEDIASRFFDQPLEKGNPIMVEVDQYDRLIEEMKNGLNKERT